MTRTQRRRKSGKQLARIQTATRRARRAHQYGPAACCLMCGHPDLDILVHGDRSLLDEHHVVGRNHDAELTALFCPNCHAQAHVAMRDGGVTLERQPSVIETVAEVLRALVTFFTALAEACARWSDTLVRSASRLDVVHPNWRAALEVA